MRFGLLLLPVILAAADAPPPGKAVSAAAALSQQAWLAGHWRMEKGGRVVDEQWMAPAAGVMLGMARTIARGKVVEHEFIQIRKGPGGALYHIALPSGQKEAAFQLVSLSSTEAVFENKEHDFPQKISYARQPDGSLLAAIEGPGKDGQTKRIEYPYKRVQ
ncbi:MAG: hypothetical protein HYX71_10665 [Opitutae bacterium]|nr:hypothetical protein [Opitutae bacterium]